MLIKENVSLRDFSTFKAGGPASFFAEPASIAELEECLSFAKSNSIPSLIIGAGSNILVSDKGYEGLVIRFGSNFSKLSIEESEKNCIVTAKAGTMLSAFGRFCMEHSLQGAEFCCGIPGSMGGAVFMNAGAYGREMKDIVSSVTYLDENKEVKTISNKECAFGYRTSFFEKEKKPIVLEAKMTLERGDKAQIEGYVNELKAKRINSQPVDVPSAGSTFKRPEGYYVGALVQEAGLKGFALDDSGAQVSAKHAGFVVNNHGTASASDIYRLIQYVIATIYEKNQVKLEPEVRLIGDFSDD